MASHGQRGDLSTFPEVNFVDQTYHLRFEFTGKENKAISELLTWLQPNSMQIETTATSQKGKDADKSSHAP
jgi:hypothetical protein